MSEGAQLILIAAASLLMLGCGIAFLCWIDIRRQRRIEADARILRRLGHVRSAP